MQNRKCKKIKYQAKKEMKRIAKNHKEDKNNKTAEAKNNYWKNDKNLRQRYSSSLIILNYS